MFVNQTQMLADFKVPFALTKYNQIKGRGMGCWYM